jgi:hypothetical protein
MGLLLQLPEAPPAGVPFPVLFRTSNQAPVSARGTLTADLRAAQPAQLYRGRGSVSLTAPSPGLLQVRVMIGGLAAERTVTTTERPRRTMQGVLEAQDLVWDATHDIVLGGTVVVPKGAMLKVTAGVNVLGQAKTNIDVAGELLVEGTLEAPVLFTRAGPSPWGGIRVLPGGRATLRHALVTQGGGDSTRHFGHRIAFMPSQPLLHASGGELLFEAGALVDSRGKGFAGSESGNLVIRDTLISRVGQGGETNIAEVLLEKTHVLEIPDGDGLIEGDDSDGVHLGASRLVDGKERPCAIRDSVFAVIEDDAIDHAGAPLHVERVWIQDAYHEGVAASKGNRLTITDSVLTSCGQAIESGSGKPDVVVEHVLIAGCGVGLRWGDEDTNNNGKLAARYTVVVQGQPLPGINPIVFRPPYPSAALNKSVYNHNNALMGPGPAGSLHISCSMVDTAAWDGINNNVGGKAPFNDAGCVGATARTLAGCPAGPLGPRPRCP